jgi:hypothetical protein
MSTPQNKRDQRREARLAQIAQAQSSRRQAPQDTDDIADETSTEEKRAVTQVQQPAPSKAPIVQQSTNVSKSTTGAKSPADDKAPVSDKPLVTSTSSTSSKAPITNRTSSTSKSTTTGKTPVASKTPTRPTGAVQGTKTPTAAKSAGIPGSVSKDSSSKEKAPTAAIIPAEPRYITKRDLRRESRREELSRVQSARRQRIQAAKRQALIQRAAIAAIVVVVVVLLGIWLWNMTHAPSASSSISPSTAYGSTIQCQANEGTVTHYHADLQIYINGQNIAIPANIGITDQCLYWTHTHDELSHVIHIESPNANDSYRLGDFLSVWTKTPNRTLSFPGAKSIPDMTEKTFFGLPIDKDHPLTVWVDGKPITGDPYQMTKISGLSMVL